MWYLILSFDDSNVIEKNWYSNVFVFLCKTYWSSKHKSTSSKKHSIVVVWTPSKIWLYGNPLSNTNDLKIKINTIHQQLMTSKQRLQASIYVIICVCVRACLSLVQDWTKCMILARNQFFFNLWRSPLWLTFLNS